MRTYFLAGCLVALPLAAEADEGMWLFNDPPVEQIAERHEFAITGEWLDHLRLSSVRFGNGGSGAFVSDKGLVLTNHHVGAGMIEKLSTDDSNLLRDGFLAEAMADELPCPDLELNVLMSIEDVTGRVNSAIRADQSSAEAAAARRAVIAEIEKQSLEETGLRSDVVTLYQGGAYHLHRYQRYTDVRLVFAPDSRSAAFGGDADNFEYPRFCLDFCFFRAYENDAPAETPHFLKWNTAGPSEGELVFTSGHPGRSGRSMTLSQLERLRDDLFPYLLEKIYRNETTLRAWAERDPENARRAERSIIGTQNGRKALVARLDGLLDPSFLRRKAESEAVLRAGAEEAFAAIEAAESELRGFAPRLRMLEWSDAFDSGLFRIARTLLRAGAEALKPDGERLEEFQEAGRVSLELGLFSDEPVYKDLETVRMMNSLTFLCVKLGADDPMVVKILDGKSPHERAAELVLATGLEDVGMRRELYESGRNAVAQSKDAMIELARLVDGEARELRGRADAIGERISQAHARIARLRSEAGGDAVYPDATFTLRLSAGVVKGYEHSGSAVPFQTTLGGMRSRSEALGGQPPFDLSPVWSERMHQLDASVPLNFVSTNDITGGNSGSPVVNRKGELVGLIFDSNAHGLVCDFAYTEERARAVSVHSAGMLEALRKIYRAERLLAELDRS